MRILTSKDTSIIVRETETYRIHKLNTESDVHVVTHQQTGQEFGLADLEDAEQFVRRQGWNTAVMSALERRAFRIGTLFNAGRLTETHILNYLNYARRYTNDVAFIQVYNQLKESVGEQFVELFETIDENAKSEIIT